MKLIRELSECIDDEIKGVKGYAKLATKIKEEHPQIAETLFQISKQEGEHVNKLHDSVAQLISEYRKTNGDPPKEMLAVYDYLHEKHIDQFNEAKRYQDVYSKR